MNRRTAIRTLGLLAGIMVTKPWRWLRPLQMGGVVLPEISGHVGYMDIVMPVMDSCTGDLYGWNEPVYMDPKTLKEIKMNLMQSICEAEEREILDEL
ncbi:hypothetical protein LCGC14_0823300 [marine sediment metagenome]|uniref:Uncharacterized protein n=1 Tax=marine sediment metagenome TaxID=412755 RepID=A0A0F9S302_9ZZZZ|nr:hypothetical protein [Candidatus Scalindua sp.]